MSTASLPRHARTRLNAVGWRKPRPGETGRQPIWPIMGGSQPAGEPADPPTPPPPAPPPPPPTPPANPPAPATGNDKGFPENTPVAEMTDKEAAAYWKYQSRKHQSRVESRADYDEVKAKAEQYDALAAASKTDQEKALEAAKAEGRSEAERLRAEADTRALRLEVALDKGMPKALAVRLQGGTREELEADADELMKLAVPAAPRPATDLGQGRRPAATAKGTAAGAEMFAERRKKPSSASTT